MPDSNVKPVRLEIIAPVFEGLGLCTSCELVLSQAGVGDNPAGRGLGEYPPEWQAEYRRLTDWVYELAAQHGDRLEIRVIDPQSPQGLFKSVRHRIRRTPTFLVQGQNKVVGWDRARLDAALARALAAQETP